ncbi:MAG: hypothetical protein HYY14_05445 [Candidatus Omnitrophica bacterium]|nr:hypothetical protein [Candidatus Omnitrophota bacterium]
MSPDEASERLLSRSIVAREDIARAKGFIVAATETSTDALTEQWLRAEMGAVPTHVDIQAAGADDTLTLLARAYSLRLGFYQAVWELVAACEVLPGAPANWQASATWRDPHGAGGLQLGSVNCLFPAAIRRPPLAPAPSTDPDVFLQGADCVSLHQGVHEAITQSLACFRRGLYLPAIVMLAAGTEAEWSECGTAVATKLGNNKLQTLLGDPFASLSRKVTEIRRTLEGSTGKDLLKAAGTNLARVTDAEVWTTTLRERRNAVHWGKAQSFIAQHSDAASLLLAAPLHLGTLETVRGACV